MIARKNGSSSSITDELITQLHYNWHVTFDGEEAGAAYPANNSVSEALPILRNSSLRVAIALVPNKLAVS